MTILVTFTCVLPSIHSASIPESEREYHKCLVAYLETFNIITSFVQDEADLAKKCSGYHKSINATLTSVYNDLESNLHETLYNQSEVNCLIKSFKDNKFLEINIIMTSAFTTSENFHRDQLAYVFEKSKRIFTIATVECLMTDNILMEMINDFSAKIKTNDDEFVCIENFLHDLDFKKIDGKENEEIKNDENVKKEEETLSFTEKPAKEEIDYDDVANERKYEKIDYDETVNKDSAELRSEVINTTVKGKDDYDYERIKHENIQQTVKISTDYDEVSNQESTEVTTEVTEEPMKEEIEYDEVAKELPAELPAELKQESESDYDEVANKDSTELTTTDLTTITEVTTNLRAFDLADLEASQSEIHSNTIMKVSPQDLSAESSEKSCKFILSNLNGRIGNYKYPSLNDEQNNCMKTKLTESSITAIYRHIALSKFSATVVEVKNRNENLNTFLTATILDIVECTDLLNLGSDIENFLQILSNIDAENAK